MSSLVDPRSFLRLAIRATARLTDFRGRRLIRVDTRHRRASTSTGKSLFPRIPSDGRAEVRGFRTAAAVFALSIPSHLSIRVAVPVSAMSTRVECATAAVRLHSYPFLRSRDSDLLPRSLSFSLTRARARVFSFPCFAFRSGSNH